MSAPIGNQNAVGNKGGRPLTFETPEALSQKCEEYFEYIEGEWHQEEYTKTNKDGSTDVETRKVYDRSPEPATATGLALFLGFESRSSLVDYKERIEFSPIIKKALLRVEHGYEKMLFGDKPTGPIFALKNMGWADKQILAGDKEEPLMPEIDYSKLSTETLAAIAKAGLKQG